MRTQHFSSALRAALESQVEVTVTIPEVVAEEPIVVEEVPAESAEDAVIAADAAGAEVQDAIAEGEELEEVTKGLESILLAVESETDGLDPTSAKYVNLAVESYIGKWNLGVSLVPSAESFGGTLSRRQATASLEANIGEVLNKAWDYIKDLWTKAMAAIRSFFGRIFIAAERLAQRGKRLNAAKLEGGAPKSEQIEVGSLVARYSAGGKIAAPKAVFDDLDKLVKAAESLDATTEAAANSASAIIEKLLAAKDEGFDAVFTEATQNYRAAVPPAFSRQAAGTTMETDIYPGEVIYTATRGENGSVRYGSRKNDVEVKGEKIKTLSQSDVKAAGQGAVVFATMVINQKQRLNALKDESSEKFLKSLKENTELTGANARKVKAFVQRAAGDITAARQITIKMMAGGVSAGLAAISVAEKSAKQYGAFVEKEVGADNRLPGGEAAAA